MKNKISLHNIVCVLLLFTIPLPAVQMQGSAITGDTPWKSRARNISASITDSRSDPSSKKIDVCALLTSADVESVQGEPVQGITPNVLPGGGMTVTQCIFHTPTFAKSVSVYLAVPDPAHAQAITPRSFWRKLFHSQDSREGEKIPVAVKAHQRPENKGENEEHGPRRIHGLGEEAFWVRSPVMGALYVLQGDTFLRISIGGVHEESLRLEKSKTLARAVVKRL